MRPLAVLALIACAVAALVFAFVRIQGDGPGGDQRIAQPAAPSQVQAAPRSTDLAVIPEAGPSDPRGVDADASRTELEPASPEVSGDWNNALEGTVVGPDKSPVAGAKVELLRDAQPAELSEMVSIMTGNSGPAPTRVQETDAEGNFSFRRLDPGPHWSLRVSHPDFQDKQVGPIDVPTEDGVRELIEMENGFMISGKVVAAGTNLPIEGAHLSLENPAAAYLPNLVKGSKPIEAVTDAHGYYELKNVAPNGMALVCTAKGYGTQIDQRDTSTVGASAKRKQIDFDMAVGQNIAGRVLAPDGSGVAGLRIDGLGSMAQTGSRGSGVSGKDGEFLISDLGEGRYSLRVEQAGLNRLNLYCGPQQASAGETNVEIHLLAQGALMGTAMGLDGPLSRFRVTIRQSHPTNAAFGQIVKQQQFRDGKGRFHVEGLTEGKYVVQVDASGYASSFSAPVDVQQGETTPDVVVHATRGGSISGTVVDIYTKEPVAGAVVTTTDNNHIDSSFTNFLGQLAPTALTKAKATTDADGHFEIPLVMPETYQVSVTKRGYTSFLTNDVVILEGTPTDLGTIALSHGATIKGTAYLPDGTPGAGVEVSIALQGTQSFGAGMRARADAEGHYVLSNVPAGSYKLMGARPPKANDSPFSKIADMHKSETMVDVEDGQVYTVDINLGGQ